MSFVSVYKHCDFSDKKRLEHLLPLHVCFGAANSVANLVFDGKIVGKKTSAFKW